MLRSSIRIRAYSEVVSFFDGREKRRTKAEKEVIDVRSTCTTWLVVWRPDCECAIVGFKPEERYFFRTGQSGSWRGLDV